MTSPYPLTHLTTIRPYLGFNGNCAEALHFYTEVLGGTLSCITYADTQMASEMPPEMASQIVHGCLQIGEFHIMSGDASPESFIPAQGMTVNLGIDDVVEAERVFSALSR